MHIPVLPAVALVLCLMFFVSSYPLANNLFETSAKSCKLIPTLLRFKSVVKIKRQLHFSKADISLKKRTEVQRNPHPFILILSNQSNISVLSGRKPPRLF